MARLQLDRSWCWGSSTSSSTATQSRTKDKTHEFRASCRSREQPDTSDQATVVMAFYTVEALGGRRDSVPRTFSVHVPDPEASFWTATTSEPLPCGRILLPLRIVDGSRSGAIGVGIVSADGRFIRGRRAFRLSRTARDSERLIRRTG
jgi:hypothetical protein